MDDRDPIEQRLRRLTRPVDPDRQAADLVAMAHVAPARPGILGSKVRLAAAFLAGLLLGSTGLAAADALPDPAQHVAHQALTRVGVDVPDPERYHGPECGDEVKKNHGGYVRDDHAMAGTDCGKPVNAGSGADETDESDERDESTPGQGKGPQAKGPCQGKPPWAGNKTMTPEEKATAQADRAAQCGTEEAEVDDAADADASTERAPDDEAPTTTTTTTEAAATTDAPTTTVAETTTTTAG